LEKVAMFRHNCSTLLPSAAFMVRLPEPCKKHIEKSLILGKWRIPKAAEKAADSQEVGIICLRTPWSFEGNKS
jgi:hypothetical protein